MQKTLDVVPSWPHNGGMSKFHELFDSMVERAVVWMEGDPPDTMRTPGILGFNREDLEEYVLGLEHALNEALCWIPDGSRMTPEQRGAKCETAYEVDKMIRRAISKVDG